MQASLISKDLRPVVLAGLVVLALAAGVGVAAGSSATKSDIVWDCGPSSPGGDCLTGRDMLGPAGFGFVNSNQNASGDLKVVGSLKNATAKTTYFVTVYCGPTHATADGVLFEGEVTTNPAGNANTAAIHIPASDLQSNCGASGFVGNGHIDFDSAEETYAGTPIPYTVP